MPALFTPQATLEQVFSGKVRLDALGISTLAWLTHEAESEEDDLSFIAIQNEIERRGDRAYRLHADEYKRLWDQHVKARGYGR